MKRLYIKVVKSSRDSYWYAQSKGEVFKVTGLYKTNGVTDENGFYVRHNGIDTILIVDWCDCEPATKEEYLAQRGGG
jgi:hypothetical protein